MPVIPENIINLQTDTIPQTIINIDIDDTGAIFVQLAHAQANIAMDYATTAGNYANSAQISSNNALHSAEVAQGHSEDASAAADRSEAARDAAEDLIPGVGRVGDFLQKTVDGAQWASFPEGIGTWGGIIGDIRNQTDLQEALADKITYPETGTTGQLLARTADGEGEWVDAPNSAVWGLIQGDIKNQTDLQNEFEHGVELTKAEYDALPSSKLTDDVNYWIKDGTNLPQTSVISADGVMYTDSQTVKGALDEQASAISDLNNGLTYNKGDVIAFNNYSARFAATSNSHNEILFTIPFDKRFSTNNMSLIITDYYFETSAGVIDERHNVSLNVPIDFILWIGITARVPSAKTLTPFVGGIFMFNGTLTVN